MKNEVMLFRGGISVDDRGCLRFTNDFNFENVKRFYQVENHRRGFIRAWHGHEKEGKYVWVAKGAALVGIVPLSATAGEMSSVVKYTLSDKSPSVLWIPAGNYNGFMSLTENTQVIFFSTLTLEESQGDDMRLPFDSWDIWQDNYR